MRLDSAVRAVVKSVPECTAAGFVDMKTGKLLGVKTVDDHPQNTIDLIAAAAAELFQGSNVATIESMLGKPPGEREDAHGYFHEAIVLSSNLTHVFHRCKEHRDMVLVVVTKVSANLGMVLAKSRMELPRIEACL